MHLRYDKPVNAVIAVAGFLFLGIFLMFTFIDFDSRQNLQPVNMAAPPIVQSPANAAAPPASAEKTEKK